LMTDQDTGCLHWVCLLAACACCCAPCTYIRVGDGILGQH
jgi:hypothetical protein